MLPSKTMYKKEKSSVEGKGRKGKGRGETSILHGPGIMTGTLYSRFLKLLVMFQWNMTILIVSMRQLSLRCMHSPKQERVRAEIISGETHSLGFYNHLGTNSQ